MGRCRLGIYTESLPIIIIFQQRSHWDFTLFWPASDLASVIKEPPPDVRPVPARRWPKCWLRRWGCKVSRWLAASSPLTLPRAHWGRRWSATWSVEVLKPKGWRWCSSRAQRPIMQMWLYIYIYTQYILEVKIGPTSKRSLMKRTQ